MGLFAPGERIFLPGSAGEPTALVAEVLATPGAQVTTTFLPGVNRLDPSAFGEGVRVTGLFMQPALAEAQREGRFRHLPVSYFAFLKALREGPPFDACILQVSPPDAQGRCSLGPAVEFAPEVMRRARRLVAVVNPAVPRVAGGVSVAHADLAATVEGDTPLPTYGAGEPEAASAAIADHVAGLIPDGAALQVGLGKAPAALMGRLRDRRRLRLHSGMLSDGVMALAESGALDPDHSHLATTLLGGRALYDWAAHRADLRVRGVEHTHDPARLAAVEGLVAVNGALEVDLFGQANLELAGGRAVSGSGGASDFAHAARLSPGGLSVVALPSTFGAAGSRITAGLAAPSLASLPRTDVDVVVTEHGVADLRGRSTHERAEALIAVAAPAARSELTDRWREIAARL